jgi:hypothetical protein
MLSFAGLIRIPDRLFGEMAHVDIDARSGTPAAGLRATCTVVRSLRDYLRSACRRRGGLGRTALL